MPPGQKGGPEERGDRLLAGWFFYEGTRPMKERKALIFFSGGNGKKVHLAAIEGHAGDVPRIRPRRICAEKGYAKGVVRRYLRRRGIRITIARRTNEHRGGAFDRAIYRTRNLVERLINRLKHFRRVATRYEKRAKNYEAMLKIAAIKIWL